MNEIVAKFISDCKNSGRTFVALSQVPYEVMEELARRREPALVDSLKESVNMVKKKLEHIQHNVQLHKNIEDVKDDIEEALDYMGNWEWVCGDVLDKAAGLDHLPVMKELADVCLNNEQLRHYQAILYLDGASTLEEDVTWNIKPVIDSAIEEVTSNLTDHSAVFDTETFRVAFFDI